MVTGVEVMELLRPNHQWTISGEDFESITFFDDGSITEKEFQDGFAKVEAAKSKAASELSAAKQLILDRLGLTAEEAALLLK